MWKEKMERGGGRKRYRRSNRKKRFGVGGGGLTCFTNIHLTCTLMKKIIFKSGKQRGRKINHPSR